MLITTFAEIVENHLRQLNLFQISKTDWLQVAIV